METTLKLTALASTHQWTLMAAFAAVALVVVLSAIWVSRIRPSARRRRRQASKVIKRLATIAHPGQQFAYLRKVDPFTFEEVLLTALEQRGLRVVRNRRYTGDGGIDGQFQLGKDLVLIQAKRYSTAINKSHVAEFARLCLAHNKRGVFIHTGRTGKSSRVVAYAHPDIAVISGRALLDLITGQSLSVFSEPLPQKLKRPPEGGHQT